MDARDAGGRRAQVRRGDGRDSLEGCSRHIQEERVPARQIHTDRQALYASLRADDRICRILGARAFDLCGRSALRPDGQAPELGARLRHRPGRHYARAQVPQAVLARLHAALLGSRHDGPHREERQRDGQSRRSSPQRRSQGASRALQGRAQGGEVRGRPSGDPFRLRIPRRLLQRAQGSARLKGQASDAPEGRTARLSL